MMREDTENQMVIDELWHDDEYDYYLREDPYRGYDDWADDGHDDYVGRLLGDYD